MKFALSLGRGPRGLRSFLSMIAFVGLFGFSIPALSSSQIGVLKALDMSDGLVVLEDGAYEMEPKLRLQLQQEESDGTLQLRSGMRVRVEVVPIPGVPGTGPQTKMVVKMIPLGRGGQ
jgi:hypothetical protein